MVPRKDQPTFNNQDGQEAQVWENAIMSMCETFATYWAKVCMIDKLGYTPILPFHAYKPTRTQ